MARAIAVELLEEDGGGKGSECVGLLQKSLDGTRDAAANFQTEVHTFMYMHLFKVGRYNSRTYFHTGKRIRVMVRGDDLVSAVSSSALEVENMRGREVLSCSCRTLATVQRSCKRTECSTGSSGQSGVVGSSSVISDTHPLLGGAKELKFPAVVR